MEKGESRIDKEFAFPLLENMARVASKGHHKLMQHLQELRGGGCNGNITNIVRKRTRKESSLLKKLA